MPIYLVRWPDLSGALVRARNEEQLVETLDELGNPEGCSWKIYRGPLWIEFDLPVRFDVKDRQPAKPLGHTDIVVDKKSVEEFARDGMEMHASIPNADTGDEMSRAIFSELFPNLQFAGEAEPKADIDKLVQALIEDLAPFISDSWKGAALAKKTDFLSQVAVAMDAPIEIVRRYAEPKEPVPPKPKKPTRPKKR